jgi:cobalt-zinc-cadmium efflux system protein
VQGGLVAVVSGMGIVINGLTAFIFFKDRNHDLNIKATFLHMAGDAVVSLGVLISGIIIRYTGWFILDPIVSLALLLVVVIGTWGLMRDSVLQILDRVPKNIALADVEDFILDFPGVKSIHDLHVWHLTTNTVALTTHLVIEEDFDSNKIIEDVQHGLIHEFDIHKTTIQVETGISLEKKGMC